MHNSSNAPNNDNNAGWANFGNNNSSKLMEANGATATSPSNNAWPPSNNSNISSNNSGHISNPFVSCKNQFLSY